MPELSRFFGIGIAMYYDDHEPPHFHIRYHGVTARVRLPDLSVLDSGVPNKILELALWWALEHISELTEAWESVSQGKQPNKIAPLRKRN